MTSEYAMWISAYLDQGTSIGGQCRPVCELMRRSFPELELHGGRVRTPLGYDLHWWLVSPSGEVVDPTASQFEKLAPEDYEDAGTTDPLVLLQRFVFTQGSA